MSNLAPVLNDRTFESLPAWDDVKEVFRKDAVPHCWAVKAPVVWHLGILEAMSELYLGMTNLSSHPDLTVAGELDKPAAIGNKKKDINNYPGSCRWLTEELSLRPVFGRRRLGVVLAADKLLPSAANCLLKTAEEPPSHACLLFLMEGDAFLPTLKSRSRFTVLSQALTYAAKPLPSGDAEWAEWFRGFKDGEDPEEQLASWTSYLMRTDGAEAAAKTDRLRLLVRQKKLSQAMVCDLLTLTLKEELPFELIFGGFR